MALEIIGAGFGRTGTLSMKVALEQLGYDPCYHMAEVLMPRPGLNDGHLDAWYDFAVNRKPMDWRWLLKSYRACVDFPTCLFYRELIEAFPQARVILTTRDPEKWFKSWSNLWAAGDAINDPSRMVRLHKFIPFVDALIRNGLLGGKIERESSIALFNRHIEEVKASVPADRLLVFRVDQGWAPLCEFLGKPVPDTPFPHLNESDGLLEKFKALFWGEIPEGAVGAAGLLG
jgi:Sulfotransferase domain